MRLVSPLHVKSDMHWENSALQHCPSVSAVQKVFCFLPGAHPLAFIQIWVQIAAMAGGDVTSLPTKSCLFEGAHQGLPSHS